MKRSSAARDARRQIGSMDTPPCGSPRERVHDRRRGIRSASRSLVSIVSSCNCVANRVYDLKVALANLTSVPPERQKILGLFKGKLPPDDVKLWVYHILPI
jgi:hypothetical protein